MVPVFPPQINVESLPFSPLFSDSHPTPALSFVFGACLPFSFSDISPPSFFCSPWEPGVSCAYLFFFLMGDNRCALPSVVLFFFFSFFVRRPFFFSLPRAERYSTFTSLPPSRGCSLFLGGHRSPFPLHFPLLIYSDLA